MQIGNVIKKISNMMLMEIQSVITKYASITMDKQERIQNLLDILNRMELDLGNYMNIEVLLEMSTYLENYSEKVIEMFLWLKSIDKPMDIEVVQEQVFKLEHRGYTEYDDVLVFVDEAHLARYKEKLLEDELINDDYFMGEMFSREQLLEMWRERTSEEEVIQDLKEHSLEELVDTRINEAYMNCEGDYVRYAIINV